MWFELRFLIHSFKYCWINNLVPLGDLDVRKFSAASANSAPYRALAPNRWHRARVSYHLYHSSVRQCADVKGSTIVGSRNHKDSYPDPNLVSGSSGLTSQESKQIIFRLPKEPHKIYDYFDLSLSTQISLIFINISKTNYLLIIRLICTITDKEQVVILILLFLNIQRLKTFFVPSNSHMEQPTKFA